MITFSPMSMRPSMVAEPRWGRRTALGRPSSFGLIFGSNSELRALNVELAVAIGGIKHHERYCAGLGGGGGDPDGPVGDLIKRDFGSADAWRGDLKATGMAGRGWAWTAYDWDEGRLFNYVGDAQNTFPIWNATPLVALDVYEHAYFLDYQTDRASYIDAFFTNLDWDVVNGWIEQYGIPF